MKKQKPKKKRKLRYWNAYAIVVLDHRGRVLSMNTYKSRKKAFAAYDDKCRTSIGEGTSDILTEGAEMMGCRDVFTDREVRLLTNTVWKEGFEK